MKIIVDAQLPYAAERFAALGEVAPLRADEFTALALRDADALIVRSVTCVDGALLEGTGVKFVGSATSGTDHVALAYLRRAGIAFTDAAGCNSTAVAEYVAAGLLHLRARGSIKLPTPVIARSGVCDEAISSAENLAPTSIGIVGCGHVGGKVARYAAALGCRVVMNDPPLARATCEPLYRPLDEIRKCDIISIHVPLERGGTDSTFHLINEAFLVSLKPGAILINTARGAVVDSNGLKRSLRSGQLGACVLDVWENEPDIDRELFDLVTLATAHIAGHTLDAKRRAVDMLFDAALRKFGDRAEDGRVTYEDSRLCGNDKEGKVSAHGHSRPPCCHSREGGNLTSSSAAGSESEPITYVEIPDNSQVLDAVHLAVRASFDITREAARLRDVMACADARERAAGFNALRAEHPARREFHATEVRIDAGHAAKNILETLGFRVTVRAALAAGAGGRA